MPLTKEEKNQLKELQLNFGSKIFEIRSKLRIGQKEFGKPLGMSAQQVSNYEVGEANPKMSTLIKIAQTYNVSLDWLCDNESDNECDNESNNEELIQSIETFEEALETLLKLKDYFKSNMTMNFYEMSDDEGRDIGNTAGEITITHGYAGKFIETYTRLEGLYYDEAITFDEFKTLVKSRMISISKEFEEAKLRIQMYKEESKGVTGYPSEINDEDLKTL